MKLCSQIVIHSNDNSKVSKLLTDCIILMSCNLLPIGGSSLQKALTDELAKPTSENSSFFSLWLLEKKCNYID